MVQWFQYESFHLEYRRLYSSTQDAINCSVIPVHKILLIVV